MSFTQSQSTNTPPLLEVLISTMGRDGIERVAAMNLPAVQGVGYIVSWQSPDGNVPDSLLRPDVRVVKSASRGLSNNRNDAFKASAADLLLIADDDLIFKPEGLKLVIDTMQAHPEVDIATFMYVGGLGKSYPDKEFDLRYPPKGYYLTSFEIALRRRVVEGEGCVGFDSRFGIGAPRFGAGEEQFFVDDALAKGFTGRFFPKVIVKHPAISTGQRRMTPGTLMSQGIYLRTKHNPLMALPRVPVLAWRHFRARRSNFFTALWYLFKGWCIGRKPFPD